MDETLSVQGRNSLIEPAMTSNFPISHTSSVEALRGLLRIYCHDFMISNVLQFFDILSVCLLLHCELFIFGWGEGE